MSGLPAGNGSGGLVWIPAASADKNNTAGRPAVCGRDVLGLAAFELRDLRWGSAVGLYPGVAGRRFPLGPDFREGVRACFFPFLENYGKYMGFSSETREKIFQKSENFVCNSGKMGYNKVE